ncbi:CHASE2 domain-containing protein [Almyronema epifaneia]|uniref:histidine kinase n=1 Tax=Almyronema epifaneia S1 TaxID=2991925 RepID=A0ABW6IDH2_9CYAN
MRWPAVLITTPLVAVCVIAVKFTGCFQLLEWNIYDRFFSLRPTESIDERLLLITVDESDIDRLGHWPLSDATLAQLIQTLNQQQPSIIALDMYRNLPVEPGSQSWIQVMASTPNLIGVEKVVGRTVGPPDVLDDHRQVGLTDLIVDADGKVRRALLSHYNADSQVRFNLGVEAALRYLSTQGVTLEVLDAERSSYRLGQGLFVPLRPNDGGYVRTNMGGYQILLNYRGHQEHFPSISLTDVLAGRFDADLIRDRIVFIGSTAPSLNDLFYTPYSSGLINSPTSTSGVIIHANIASQLLSSALEGRPVIQVWAEPWEWIWVLIWSGVGTVGYGWLLEFNRQGEKIVARLAILLAFIALSGGILLGGSYLAFISGWWIPVIPALVALGVAAGLIESYAILKLQQQRLQLAEEKLKIEQEKIRAEMASQAKSQFLARVSHELRTPLNAILGFTQLISSDPAISSPQREYLDIINQSGEHLLALINDVLEISKIESGQVTLHKTDFNLHQLLDNLEAMLKVKALSKGLKLIFERSPAVPPLITADEGKLRQILINLLGNAIKFTQVGQVVLRVSACEDTPPFSPASAQAPTPSSDRPKPQSRLCFAIEDTGPGIAPDEADSLFDIFMQGKVGQQSGDGAGLGLPISQQLVQLMGGKITLSSTLNRGTTFQFDICVDQPQIAPQRSPDAAHQVTGLAPGEKRYRILVVEDNAVSRLLLVRMLTGLGFQVCEAVNGQAAVETCQSWQPDLIWMDMRMPVMNGLEATRRIRLWEQTRKPETDSPSLPSNPIKIIALTANAFDEDQAASLSAGCDDFVSKPFRRENILDKIAEHLGVRYAYTTEPSLSAQTS